MKQLLLILGLSLGLASPVVALEAGDRHADPYKVMTKGQVIGQFQFDNNSQINGYLLIAYQGEMYRCYEASGNTYNCILLAPKIN